MQFVQFLSLIKDVQQLLTEAPGMVFDRARPQPQSVAWDPNAGASFKGKGVTTDRESHKLDRQVDTDDVGHDYNQMHGTAKTEEPKEGDIVIVQDPTGKSTPGLITGIANGNVQIVNNNKGVNVTRPANALGLAPAAMASQLNKGGKGRSVWMYRG